MKISLQGIILALTLSVYPSKSRKVVSDQDQVILDDTLDQILNELSKSLNVTSTRFLKSLNKTMDSMDEMEQTISMTHQKALEVFKDRSRRVLESAINTNSDTGNQTQKAQLLSSLLQKEWISSLDQVEDSTASVSIQKRMDRLEPPRLPARNSVRLHGDRVKGTVTLPVEKFNKKTKKLPEIEVPVRFLKLEDCEKYLLAIIPEDVKQEINEKYEQMLKDITARQKTWRNRFRQGCTARDCHLLDKYQADLARQTVYQQTRAELEEAIENSLKFPVDNQVWAHYKRLQKVVDERQKAQQDFIDETEQFTNEHSREAGEDHLSDKERRIEILALEDVRAVFKKAEIDYASKVMHAYLKRNSYDQSWISYKEWYDSMQGALDVSQIRHDVLEAGVSALESELLAKELATPEEIHEFLSYELQMDLDLYQSNHFGHKAFFDTTLERIKDEENRDLEVKLRQELRYTWKKVGWIVLISGTIIGLLSLLMSLTAH